MPAKKQKILKPKIANLSNKESVQIEILPIFTDNRPHKMAIQDAMSGFVDGKLFYVAIFLYPDKNGSKRPVFL